MNEMLYKTNERPKSIKEWVVYTLQMLLAVFTATVLIAAICRTPISSCLLGGCLGTLLYQVLTKFKSPMFISSCGATTSAVCGALALNATNDNYLMVFCGGLIILAIYALFALIVKKLGVDAFNKLFPPTVVGAVTMVIGLNLATFIFGYVNGDSATGNVPWVPVLVAIITMLITALIAQHGKGFIKNIPFLFGIAGGYIIALLITLISDSTLVSFAAFEDMQWYPDLTFLKWRASDWSFANLGKTALYFVPVAICALLEHYSDHKTLSNIIGQDLTTEPGLDKTLIGDGAASALGTLICGLPNTSYGEGVSVIGFSKVASVLVTTSAAVVMGIMSFIAPLNAFIQSIPSCVFGGVAMILYGYIAASGLRTLMHNNVDLNDTRNLIVISVILTVGVSGIYFAVPSFAGVSLAMVLGVLLNTLLRAKILVINK